MLTTRKALYYLDKGKTKDAIRLLETCWNQEVTVENRRDIFQRLYCSATCYTKEANVFQKSINI